VCHAAAGAGFYDGLEAGCLVAAGVCLVGSLAAWRWLPARPAEPVGVAPSVAAEPVAA